MEENNVVIYETPMYMLIDLFLISANLKERLLELIL